MKTLFLFLSIVLISLPAAAQERVGKSVHDFTVTAIDGSEFKLSSLKGKKVMIVNTASKCGLTPQYESLQELYEKYSGKGFVIVGFPANNFLSQEPGTNGEIREFCDSRFGISFPMMSKISVKGDDMHPLYRWLTDKKLNGVMDSEVKWNFQKYLVNESGQLVDVIAPKESPMSDRIISWIEGKKE